MNIEQRSRFVRYAEAYAAQIPSVAQMSDLELNNQLIQTAKSWSIQHTDEARSKECERTAKELELDDVYFTQKSAERIFLARWGSLGRPTVIPASVHWAAAMCATNVSPEIATLVLPPWEAFWIEVPPGLGLTKGGTGHEAIPISSIAVVHHVRDRSGDLQYEGRRAVDGEQWVTIMTWGDAGGGMFDNHEFRRCTTEELGADLEPNDGDTGVYLRSFKLASKLVLGVLMALQSGQSRPTANKSKARRQRKGKQPSKLEFVVGCPVHVRTVDFVRDYVRIGPRKMRGRQTIQTLVRGHWKNQPCGPAGTDRRFIHIEPYWRGPEDAPIAVRPHILKGAATP